MLKYVPRKVNIVGTSASGKSTFSKQLAEVLQCSYIEMDALFWQPDWQESTNDEFFAKLMDSLNQAAWVLDGNYSRTTAIKWQDIDTIIWLNYSWTRTAYQSISRAIQRIISRQELWEGTGNKESFKKSFCSKDSIILWMLRNYHRQQRQYLAIMSDPQWQHIQFIRVHSPQQARNLLHQIKLLHIAM